MHPNERGVPNLPILPGAAASPPRGSFFLSCQSRKPVQEVGWGLASCCLRTSLVTLLGKASEILDWPPTQALPWRATPWGLRAISTSTGDAFHSATWRNSCPYRLPLSLLKTAQNHPMLVELKNGETYNGHLVSCDNWMNINLREVICTSRDGDKFWRMPECYIRGSTIKYLRIPDEIIDMVKEEVVAKGRGRGGLQQQKQQKGRGMGGAGRGVFGGRGRGGIPGTGRGQPEKKPGRQAGKQ
ncbi:U6 snRNA-associated Sm-like protein LSm4 isoform X1 [Myotis myotis]|uniref:U6 snRNA-associated Sm-like protein LSm4 isoform X1 n=1 Tax=Myotis myotis TaxID=51298 RepID=UPI001748CD84|nr:U6 snRNA-associated Sm-like protein LSm4 isoform X1 [Myotis myotis]